MQRYWISPARAEAAIASVDVGYTPYVINAAAGAVLVIDTATNTVVGAVKELDVEVDQIVRGIQGACPLTQGYLLTT